jgi:hypothetical protein
MSENKNISSLRKWSYLLFSVIIISGIFSYYLFVFVAGKEKEIIARNYRVLDKIGNNLQSRLYDYYKKADRRFKLEYKGKPGEYYNYTLNDSISIDSTFPSTVQFSKKFKEGIKQEKISFEKIFQELRRTDIFKYHIISDTDGRIIYSENGLLNQQSRLDTSISNQTGKFNNRKKIEIAGEEYFLFSHPFVLNSRSYILTGVVAGEDYSHEIHAVPGWNMLVTMVVIFLILILFPFLKSLLISSQETLTSTDILATILSLFLIFCIYTFLQVHLYAVVVPDGKRKADMLINLATKMDSSFQHDLQSLYEQAKYYDVCKANAAYKINYYDLKHEPKGVSNLADRELIPASDTTFKYIFWLDKNGIEQLRWTTDTSAFPQTHNNYEEREYFRKIVNKNYWFLGGDTSKRFYFEPVYSWLDGSYRGVLTQPGSMDSLPVVAIASELKSVQQVTLPEELNYCIIDESGKILFHSDERRNSNENILEECNDEILRAAMLARTNTEFDHYYMGANCRFFVRPVAHLPLFILTFADCQYSENINLQIFILTFVHVILNLLVIILVLAVYILFVKKRKILTKQRIISFEELYPACKNETKDNFLILYNSGLSAFSLMISEFIYDYPMLILSWFITCTICSASLFIFLRVKEFAMAKGLIVSAYLFFFLVADLLLWIIILPAFDSDPNAHNTTYKIFGLTVGLQFVFTAILSMHFQLIKTPDIFKSILTWINDKMALPSGKFYKKYVIMLISCFVLTGAVPTLRFYEFFYNEEYSLLLKYMQLQVAKNTFKNSSQYTLNAKQQNSSPAYYNYLNAYFETTIDTFSKFPVVKYNEELNAFKEYVNVLRITINPVDKKIKRLSYPKKRDPSLYFGIRNNSQLNFYYTNLSNNEKLKINNLLVQSNVPKYAVPQITKKSFFFFYAGILCFFTVIYFFIKFFVRRFFLFEFFPGRNAGNSTMELTGLFKGKKASGFPIRQIIVGVPRSGKNDMVIDVIKKLYESLLEDKKTDDFNSSDNLLANHFVKVDLTKINYAGFCEEILKSKTEDKFFHLQHFDYDISSPDVNKKKLSLIESLVQEKTCHVILTSSIHPGIFLKSLRKDKSMFETEDYINNNDYFNWSAVLSGFDLFIHPIQWPPKHIIRVDSNDQAVYKAHHTLFQYFHALWGSLSKNEKFVLYDLAEDNIANYQNRDAILSLYHKGIIVFENEPRLIHESLRDFILSEVNDEDVYKEKATAQRDSSWSKFRLPFLLIIVILCFFVFYTQKETFNQVIAIIAAFAASIPSLIKLLSSGIGKAKET